MTAPIKLYPNPYTLVHAAYQLPAGYGGKYANLPGAVGPSNRRVGRIGPMVVIFAIKG